LAGGSHTIAGMSWVSLCALDELEEGQGKYVEIDGFRLAVFRQGESVHVMDDECPHAGGSLASGFIDDGCAVCPLHFWAFNLNTGELRNGMGCTIRTYPTRLEPREGESPLVQADLPIY